MMISFALVVAVISIFLMYCISTSLKKANKSLPPGPSCRPPLLHMGQLSPVGECYSKLVQWAQEYGKMYTLQVAGKTVLVLNDANLMKDILSRMEATGRKQVEKFNFLTWSGRHGIFQMEGNEWWEQKQFFVRALAHYGFGRENRMESLVLGEADKLCGWIQNENCRVQDNKFFLKPVVVQITGNIVWAMLTGKTTEQMQAPKIILLVGEWLLSPPNIYEKGAKILSEAALSEYEKAKQLCKEIQNFVELQFKQHRESINSGEPPRDIIDAYIEKVENCRDPASTFYGEKGWKNSFSNIVFVIIASSDTVRHSITWILFYLSVDEEVQAELQREIDETIGMYRDPSLGDKNRMPYMEAVMLEAFRLSTLIPWGGTNVLLEDLEVGYYRIPKGTSVLSNWHLVHNDKRIWGDPENFRPARFLGKGRENLKNFVVSFHVGKRSCPGVHFARNIIFLIVVKLLQTFTFAVDPNVENVKDYLEPMRAHMRIPKNLALVVRNRK